MNGINRMLVILGAIAVTIIATFVFVKADNADVEETEGEKGRVYRYFFPDEF